MTLLPEVLQATTEEERALRELDDKVCPICNTAYLEKDQAAKCTLKHAVPRLNPEQVNG